MSGVQEQGHFDTLLEEISDDVNLDEPASQNPKKKL